MNAEMSKKEIKKAAAVLGSLGGKAGTGIAKARSTEQARKAALIGAAKRKEKKK